MTNVRCWNCGMDFEVVSSAENSKKQPLTIYIPGMSDTDSKDE